MKKFLLVAFLLTGWSNAWTQISFKTRVSQRNISTDERLRVSFIAQGNSRDIYDGRISPPSFEGFRAMGPFVSQEFSYINGSSFYKKSYSYTLMPEKTGKLTIGPATFKSNGKKYKTDPVTITVTKGQKPVQNAPSVRGKTNGKTSSKASVKDIFLVAQVTENNPYVNQAIGLTYKLYIPKSYGVQNYQELSQPEYNGFWAQDIDRNISGPFQGEINGKPYEYYVLKKKLLFPQQSGKLTIKPLKLSIDIQVPVIRQMGYFQIRDFENKRINLSSGPKTINVKPLPEKGKPTDFTGAVGQFDFYVKADKNEVKTGEAATITVGVKGIGNLKLFNLPTLKAPEGIEIYDPTHTENVRSTFAGNKGEVMDKYIIIPNHNGKFIIPGMRFSYFNPETQSYETKTTEDIILLASGNSDYASGSSSINNNQPATDFRYIKEKEHLVDKNPSVFFNSRSFYILTGIPFLLALLFFAYKKYMDNRVIDENEIRYKKRKNLAQKYLKEATNNTQNKDLFYAHLEKANHNFLKAKLKIDSKDLSKENIKKQLLAKGINEKEINQLIEVLNNCEMARYTPFGAGDIRNDLKKAEEIINALDKRI